jgi:hypothetical protein
MLWVRDGVGGESVPDLENDKVLDGFNVSLRVLESLFVC